MLARDGGMHAAVHAWHSGGGDGGDLAARDLRAVLAGVSDYLRAPAGSVEDVRKVVRSALSGRQNDGGGSANGSRTRGGDGSGVRGGSGGTAGTSSGSGAGAGGMAALSDAEHAMAALSDSAHGMAALSDAARAASRLLSRSGRVLPCVPDAPLLLAAHSAASAPGAGRVLVASNLYNSGRVAPNMVAQLLQLVLALPDRWV